MTTTETATPAATPAAPAVDPDRLDAFIHQFVLDLGATVQAAGVVLGDKLGLYAALAAAGPSTPADLAQRTGTHERYVAEWLAGQAAGGYVSYDAADATYHLSPEQAFALADETSPAFVPGAFQLAVGSLRDEPRILEAFRTGAGMGWHEHDGDVFAGCERFFRPGYAANLTSAWIPALDGVEEKLRRGAEVADVGCGYGASTVLMAQAYPASSFTGFDYHAGSVEQARARAAEAGVGGRARFEAAAAAEYTGDGYDLVTSFDCLHDMGDPLTAARHVRGSLADDGTWLIVEPAAGDRVEDNLNPVGRVYYGFSTLLCVPNAISQGGTETLGAQAGEARLRTVLADAGFTRVRLAAQTPLNLVLEARP
jgi:SAM-dependent methyltransferase